MTSETELPPQNSVQKSRIFSFIALLLGILAISLAAIFIRLSERELGHASTILYHFVISGFVLWFWSNFPAKKNQSSTKKNEKYSTYTFSEWIWLLGSGLTFATGLLLWA